MSDVLGAGFGEIGAVQCAWGFGTDSASDSALTLTYTMAAVLGYDRSGHHSCTPSGEAIQMGVYRIKARRLECIGNWLRTDTNGNNTLRIRYTQTIFKRTVILFLRPQSGCFRPGGAEMFGIPGSRDTTAVSGKPGMIREMASLE